MPEPRVPKFRVPAALVSPASLFLIGGIIYYFTLDRPSEDELNDNIGREFPDVSFIGQGVCIFSAVAGACVCCRAFNPAGEVVVRVHFPA